jgi:hypothetical protein
MEPIFELLAQARDLSLPEQRELNRLLSENIQAVEEIEYVRTTGFKIGDAVTFFLRPRNEVTITIDSFSRDGMGIRGTDANGAQFIVSTIRCSKV